MSNRQKALYSDLPRAVGLLQGTVSGMDFVENVDKTAIVKNLEEAVALIEKARKELMSDIEEEFRKSFNDRFKSEK